ARFSGLYGHWYPHGRDYPTFLRALVNECAATLEAMRAIRGAIPGARLLQTEDLGKTFATGPLLRQAAHENERRWLSLDLLDGRVDSRHPWHGRLLDAGIGSGEIERFAGGEARPDLLGINHYLTSERFLDHRPHLYPWLQPGGNGRDTYVDAEAVRVKRLEPETGLEPRLREAWARYAIPIAITEIHHGCHRDEQLRWFAEAWETAARLRGEGMDLRAVTLWSLFGNVDWRFLLSQRVGHYDTGAFDVRGGTPRPTAVARAARAYAAGEAFDHPALDSPGWWRRPPRLYPWSGRCDRPPAGGRKLLITGATGTLGGAFARLCGERALPFHLTARGELDLGDPASIARALERHAPWAVINAAGVVRVADAEWEVETCMAANAGGAAALAGACAAAGAPLVTFSSDLVFDGRLGRRYHEGDEPRPATVYGRSKAEAERRVLAAGGKPLIIRTSAFFGPWDRYNFAWRTLSALARGETVRACSRTRVSPTFVPDLCHATLDLLIDGETGLWHLANDGDVSWFEFAKQVADGAGYDQALVVAEDGPEDLSTALTSRRGIMLRSFDSAREEFLRSVEVEEVTAVAAE
ncbi:MAG: SDR family oxidoreductase, partial [Allosphingosinicella sp.]